MSYIYRETAGVPIKSWTEGVAVEMSAAKQLRNLAEMPFIYKHVAAMPDIHWGMGATIGSVIATQGAIIPAAVGVDIGCGMMAVQTDLDAAQLPDNLAPLRSAIEAAVPHGRTDNGAANDVGAWSDKLISLEGGKRWQKLMVRYAEIIKEHPRAEAYNTARHLGTLGTGNHFIEICLDEDDHVWAMLHSGSRGPGNKIGMYFIERAKKDMERWFINLPDKDLAYIPEGSPLFVAYRYAVNWAQDFATANRETMMLAVLNVMRTSLPKFELTGHVINCHHNYVARENHFGSNVWLTRKGAVRAREGDFGIIPGSMGTASYIVRGKGNADSFHSCSHGAGRAMSRTEAKKRFSLADHAAATAWIECRKDEGVLDETPGAYKDIDKVMAAQTDLVDVVHTLRQVVNVKG